MKLFISSWCFHLYLSFEMDWDCIIYLHSNLIFKILILIISHFFLSLKFRKIPIDINDSCSLDIIK